MSTARQCAPPGCAAPGAIKRCPDCRRLGLVEGSYFCDKVFD